VQHDILGIVAARAAAPLVELLGEIDGGLAAERRVGGADAFAPCSVARGAGGEAARGIAALVEGDGSIRRNGCAGRRRDEGQRRIVSGNSILLSGRQLPRDRLHLGMPAPSIRIGFELCRHIAAVQPGEARRAGAIAAPIDAVTGDARIGRARVAAAQGDQLSSGGELVGRTALHRAAAGEQQARKARKHAQTHRFGEPPGRGGGSGSESPGLNAAR
jgi:hypothetical protein